MSDQLDLFDPRPGLVGKDHPDTSAAAAISVMPRTGTQRRKVLDHIGRCGYDGATDAELQAALDLSGNSQRPRRVELVEAGLIIDSGRRRAGHIVWVLS
jgi:hypothetical protein